MPNHPLIEVHREGAEVFHGTDLCKIKTAELLVELQLPKGLLPLQEIEEMGYNRATGFMWLRQKEATRHVFMVIGNTVLRAVRDGLRGEPPVEAVKRGQETGAPRVDLHLQDLHRRPRFWPDHLEVELQDPPLLPCLRL